MFGDVKENEDGEGVAVLLNGVWCSSMIIVKGVEWYEISNYEQMWE